MYCLNTKIYPIQVAQPLAHLYFLLVLETLSGNKSLNLPTLREETQKISKVEDTLC